VGATGVGWINGGWGQIGMQTGEMVSWL